MKHKEFKLGVPILNLSDEDDGDCSDLKELYRLLDVTPLAKPLICQFDQFDSLDEDVLLFRSDVDSDSFLAIDMMRDPTDQMSVVGLLLCSKMSLASEVFDRLQSLQQNAEVMTALCHGDLGLMADLQLSNFPRRFQYAGSTTIQNMQVYQFGELIKTSSND